MKTELLPVTGGCTGSPLASVFAVWLWLFRPGGFLDWDTKRGFLWSVAVHRKVVVISQCRGRFGEQSCGCWGHCTHPKGSSLGWSQGLNSCYCVLQKLALLLSLTPTGSPWSTSELLCTVKQSTRFTLIRSQGDLLRKWAPDLEAVFNVDLPNMCSLLVGSSDI